MTEVLRRVALIAEELGDVEILVVEVRVDGEDASGQLLYMDGKQWRQSLSSEQQVRTRTALANRRVARRGHPGADMIEGTSDEGRRWRHIVARSPAKDLRDIFGKVTAELTSRQPDRVMALTVHMGAEEVVADLRYLGGPH